MRRDEAGVRHRSTSPTATLRPSSRAAALIVRTGLVGSRVGGRLRRRSWSVAAGSQAGYRVEEVLAGQDTVAVRRTDDVTGQLTVDSVTVRADSFTVDMTNVTSD